VESGGTQDVGVEAPSRSRLELRYGRGSRSPVDLERSLSLLRHGQHQLVPFRIGRKLDDLDGDRTYGPSAALAADSGCPVRRVERARDRLGKTGQRGLVALNVDRRTAREDDEAARVSCRAALGGYDGVPLLRPRDARDARFDPAKGARIVEVRAQGSWGSMSP
jgi:hypothetical protein